MKQTKKTLDLSQQKHLAKTWHRAGAVLEEVREAELKSMSKAEHLAAFYRVLAVSSGAKPRLISELMDYQRKLYRRQG